MHGMAVNVLIVEKSETLNMRLQLIAVNAPDVVKPLMMIHTTGRRIVINARNAAKPDKISTHG
jgi:hypothetical protein